MIEPQLTIGVESMTQISLFIFVFLVFVSITLFFLMWLSLFLQISLELRQFVRLAHVRTYLTYSVVDLWLTAALICLLTKLFVSHQDTHNTHCTKYWKNCSQLAFCFPKCRYSLLASLFWHGEAAAVNRTCFRLLSAS